MTLLFLLFIGLLVYLITKNINKKPKRDYLILRIINFILKIKCFGIINILHRFYIFITNPFCKSKENIGKDFQNESDMLVIFSLAVLIILLFFPFYRYSHCCQSIVLIFIIWRLAEILVYQLHIIFDNRKNGIETSSFPRSIILFLVNVFEVISIYAILYLSLGAIGYCKYKAIQKPFEALYFSIFTFSTAGFGDIVPINRCGKILVFSEIAIGILLLVIFFGIFISRWKSKDE